MGIPTGPKGEPRPVGIPMGTYKAASIYRGQ